VHTLEMKWLWRLAFLGAGLLIGYIVAVSEIGWAIDRYSNVQTNERMEPERPDFIDSEWRCAEVSIPEITEGVDSAILCQKMTRKGRKEKR